MEKIRAYITPYYTLKSVKKNTCMAINLLSLIILILVKKLIFKKCSIQLSDLKRRIP